MQDKYTSLVVGQDSGFRAYGIFQEFDELDVMQQRVEVNGVRVGFALCVVGEAVVEQRRCGRRVPQRRIAAVPHLHIYAFGLVPGIRSAALVVSDGIFNTGKADSFMSRSPAAVLSDGT